MLAPLLELFRQQFEDVVVFYYFFHLLPVIDGNV
jgi:hypothetical protein